MKVRAIVLAAGAGRRFGGRKLEARFAGRPILQHVLDALAAAGLDDPLVVLAPHGPAPASMTWRRAERVENPDRDRGLSSSLQVGWHAAKAADPPPDAVLVVLGDQPLLRPDVIRALVEAPLDATRPIVAPRYAATEARNPVRIEPAGGRLVEAATGDRGLGPLLEAAPSIVRWLDVEGDNPDIDERSELARLAEADWAERVRRNRDQVTRLREGTEDADHYAPVAAMFRDDPRRTGDPVLDRLRSIAQPGDTWLDVGAGAGRYALPLALGVREVIAVEPSHGMVSALRDGLAENGIGNVRIVEARWPDARHEIGTLPVADVALIAHVGHDTDAIGPFLDALEAAARRACVAVMQELPPASVAAPFFLAVHGEAREPLPALPDLVDLLEARGAQPEVELVARPSHAWRSRDELLAFLRRQTWVSPGSAGDRVIEAALDRLAVPRDGPVTLPTDAPEAATRIGIVRWSPALRP
jgi:CTP:molybdopterin cytidylyltransferase MocA/SAM-dependent methyltransferase